MIGKMKLRALLVLVLMGLVVGLTPAAYALPPDPTWISGFWDDADYDDVNIMITSSVGAVDVLSLCEIGPVLSVLGVLGSSDETSPSAPATSPYQTRAPPSA